MKKIYDITILTDRRYVNPSSETQYIKNILFEDNTLIKALSNKGIKVYRTNWDNPDFNWNDTEYIIFRSTWDYFDRFNEFSIWLEKVSTMTKLINPKSLIYWNIDKHYLLDIQKKGIRIPNTIFIKKKECKNLKEICSNLQWDEFILKPAISGAARHTYKFKLTEINRYEKIFKSLILEEVMMIQEFEKQIITKGEVSFMLFGGKYSHAILKKAKKGDFRVQDDFGGTIENYIPNDEEIKFIEQSIKVCKPIPVYARIDVMWNNQNEMCVGEIELIEPELWFRMNPNAAQNCAVAIKNYISEN